MRSKMLPFAVLAGVLAVFLVASSCGNGSAVCPTCGTDKNGTVGQIGIMLVPEHNGNGEPGGPFNIFDISWVDSVNHFYYVTDRIGLDVPMFSTRSDIAVAAIGGDNSVAEAGNNASTCFDTVKTPTDPPGSPFPRSPALKATTRGLDARPWALRCRAASVLTAITAGS